MITRDIISVDTSEPDFVNVHYVQVDDGIDMGGRLCFEQENVPTVVELLHACLNTYAFPETERRCGRDTFVVYESGPEQRPITNILNRRPPDGVPHSGVSGLMMTRSAAEDLVRQLLALPAGTRDGLSQITTALNRQLWEAAAAGNSDAIRTALRQGADVNVRNQYRESALNMAAEHGHVDAVEVLLKAGADIENLDVADKTPLMSAAFAGHIKVVDLLLRHGARINRDLLNTLQLKVNILEENTEAGMVLPGAAEAWQSFLDYMVKRWQEQEAQGSS